jgi:hypothetical protein
VPEKPVDGGPVTTEQIACEIKQHAERCGCRRFNATFYKELRESGVWPYEIKIRDCRVFNGE